MQAVRVRFAPSPTGPLHIGGLRTALYNYLFAKKHKGSFILRIEDTDQNRYVEGAEAYILEALAWAGLDIDEGPVTGGDYGPYRQSERKEMYRAYAEELVSRGCAYYAFDTADELEEERKKDANFKYGSGSRNRLRNSLTMNADEIKELRDNQETVIRLKFPERGQITVHDKIRGTVDFDVAELDDKVLLKGDGMPTYHLANIVDDHLMKITHVIRGEEWLPSTAHHVYMYESLGWEPPQFAHLPLLFKPSGKGKLSKRDGAKFGFPVFPLNWSGQDGEVFEGFREDGYLPEALINFLAFLGWSPKTENEVLSLNQMTDLFDLDHIVKSGARFDIDKALWYNQQYLIQMDDHDLAEYLRPQAQEMGYAVDNNHLRRIAGMMKERVHKVGEILTVGYYLVERPHTYDRQTLDKKLKEENTAFFTILADELENSNLISADDFSGYIKGLIQEKAMKMGEVLPVLRIALTGTMQGPDLFETFSLLGKSESAERIRLIL